MRILLKNKYTGQVELKVNRTYFSFNAKMVYGKSVGLLKNDK